MLLGLANLFDITDTSEPVSMRKKDLVVLSARNNRFDKE